MPKGDAIYNPDVQSDIDMKNTYKLINVPGSASTSTTVYNVKAYGAVGDGSTDDSVAVLAAITAAYNANGGVVYFPASSNAYRINSQIAIPNDGASPPKQPTIIFKGDGSWKDGSWAGSVSKAASRLDLRYSASVAKIDTRGGGLLKISDIAFTDGGNDNLAFIQTTNTTLIIRDCSFDGTVTGVTGTQDAIILGGTTTNLDGTSTAAFQGYGTIIDGNWFNHIRTGVYGRVFCNSVVISNNTWGTGCYSNTNNFAAIVIDGTTGGAGKNFIYGNLIESVNYNQAIVLKNSEKNFVIGNASWDAIVPLVRLTGTAATSIGNTIMGWAEGDVTLVDTAGLNNYTIIDPSGIKAGTDAANCVIQSNGVNGSITNPVISTLLHTYPPSSADANWNTLKIAPAGIGSVLLFGTSGGSAHMPYFQAQDDTIIFFGKNDTEGMRLQSGLSVGSSTDPGTGNLLLNGLTASSFIETDVNKVLVSKTASQMRTDLSAEYTGNKGAASGYASLDGSGKVPAAQLPTLSSGTIAVTAANLKGDGAGNAVAATETGTGDTVLATSPTLVTPTIGVATATSVNKWTLTAPSTAATLTAGADGLTYTLPEITTKIGFRHIPQNSQSAPYTTVLNDSGKHLYHPAADANNRTFTIDSNANVAYPIGTAIMFVNLSANNLSIAITADTMYLAGAGTTGTRTLAQYGKATAVKTGTTEWVISGVGLS